MKHFLNLLITIILTAMSVGIAYLQWNYTPPKPGGANVWALLYIPWIGMAFAWGWHIRDTYK